MLTLYRADKLGNKTLPEKYLTDGLLTKQLNSGDDPSPYKKYGWLETIKNHIYPESKIGEFIHDTSQYLSFTLDYRRAMFYLATKENLRYHKVEENPEGFIFIVSFDTALLQEIGCGIYIYKYKCNYSRRQFDYKFRSLLSMYVKCNICSLTPNYHHQLLVIDAEKYLINFKEKYFKEYKSSLKDKEWLLMPLDPMVDPSHIGFQSRIQIADFWDVEFYQYD